MLSKIWAIVIAIITGLALALKVSTNKTKSVKKELETEKVNREVDNQKHEIESEILVEQQKVIKEAPKVVVRPDRPTGNFGDRRLK